MRGDWMLFVDGENLTARGQSLFHTHSRALVEGRFWQDNTYLWLPAPLAQHSGVFVIGYRGMFPMPQRAYYYTTAGGDRQALEAVHDRLQALDFAPVVFPYIKKTGRSKGIDIALARDMLGHAYKDTYDVAVVVTGDADYLPLVDEVQQLGKAVIVSFFGGPSNGLDTRLRRAADHFIDLTERFMNDWQGYASQIAAGQAVDDPVRIPERSPRLQGVEDTG